MKFVNALFGTCNSVMQMNILSAKTVSERIKFSSACQTTWRKQSGKL